MNSIESSIIIRILSRWLLLPILCTVALVCTMSGILQGAGNAPEMLTLFYGGMENPLLVRILGIVIVSLWISIGGFLLLFACHMAKTDLPKALIISVLGLGVSLAGTLGGFHHLTAHSDLIHRFQDASDPAQTILTEQVTTLLQLIEAHIQSAEFFSYLGFFMVA